MKTVTGLNAVVTDLRGVTIKERDGEKVRDSTPRDHLLGVIGMSRAESGKQAIKLMSLGRALMENNDLDSWELEDADFDLLKSLVDRNEVNYVTFVQATLAQLFSE